MICFRHLYVLYNNYIYNVYKDGKYRLEGGHRNDMNIKYRLLCKRLIKERKRVGVIQYYNVLFIMELLSDKDIWSLSFSVRGNISGEVKSKMNSISLPERISLPRILYR